jgi:hypothetical protein
VKLTTCEAQTHFFNLVDARAMKAKNMMFNVPYRRRIKVLDQSPMDKEIVLH